MPSASVDFSTAKAPVRSKAELYSGDAQIGLRISYCALQRCDVSGRVAGNLLHGRLPQHVDALHRRKHKIAVAETRDCINSNARIR